MNINQVAKISGVSVRTLHHYDNISLLSPERNRDNAYREYSTADMDRLQQILFFKECGFKLDQIQKLLGSLSFDRGKALELQKKYLLHEKSRIDKMLKTLENTQRALKGEINMTNKDKFEGFDFSHNPYEEEARNLWGDEAVTKSKVKLDSYSEAEKSDVAGQMDGLFRELAALRHEAPSSKSAQEATARLYCYFNDNFGSQYTPEVFASLGRMYVEDGRFTKNIDKFGSGLAAFLKEAMEIYAESLV